MKLLLDTHTFLWFISGSASLSPIAQKLIEDTSNQLFLSIASLWEVAIKVSLGKISLAQPFDTLMLHQMELNGIIPLAIEIEHTVIVSKLPFYHRDPFDRLLIAQAMAERMPLVSADTHFDAYEIKRLW